MQSSPKYQQLAATLREWIAAGTYQTGDKLPSENELVVSFGYSRHTIRQSLALLESEGLIERRHGSGSIVIDSRGGNSGSDQANRSIAVVTTYIGEYIFPDILRAIEEILADHNFLTMIFATKNRVDNERRILQDILKRQISGLIIEGTKSALPNPNIDLYQEFERRGIPIVFIHSSYPDLTGAVRVVADDKQGGIDATRYLIEAGHQRIAGIFKSDDIQGHLRYAGYSEALRDHNLPLVDDHVLWYTTESSQLVTSQGRQIIGGCTAVICYNDEIALQLMSQLRLENLRIPEDVSVISFDNSTYSELSVPKITSCSQHKRQIGVLAASKMMSLLRGKPQGTSVLPWTIIEKESVRRIK